MTVFVTFGGLSWQKGSAAQLVSLTAVARALRGDVEFVLESHAFDLDAPAARELGIRLVGHPGSGRRSPREGSLRLLAVHGGLIAWAALKALGFDWRGLVQNSIAQSLLRANLVADLSGDSYRDRPGGVALAHTCFLLSAIWCGKPVAIVSQSLGPFKWYSRRLTRFCLNCTSRIYTREQRTSALLRGLGVNPDRITLAPDLAFCLPTATAHATRRFLPDDRGGATRGDTGAIIGISVSCLMKELSRRGSHHYLEKMARICTFIRTRYRAAVWLVPHVVTPRHWGQDDVAVARDILALVGQNSGVCAIEGDPSPCELKGVISQCDLFLGARMHAAIAALSSGVPTIMLSWSHKYPGLMEEIGLQKFVWSLESRAEELEALIEELWQERAVIRHRLHAYTRAAQDAVHAEVARILAIGQAHCMGPTPPRATIRACE